MDDLVAKSKDIFPDADDEELDAMFKAVRQTAPDAPDDQILQIASKVKEQHDQSQGVRDYVKNKYGIGERNKIVEQNAEEASGGNGAAALAALGAGLAGRDATSAGQSVLNSQRAAREGRLANFDKARGLALEEADVEDKEAQKLARKDPNSDVSKAMQQMAIEDYRMDPATASKIPAEVLETRLPGLKYKAERADKDRTYELAKKDQASKEQLARTKASDTTAIAEAKLSEGQKAVDKDYAKDYNDWTSGGKNQAEASVAKLKGTVERLKAGKGETGASLSGLRSNLPSLFQDADFQRNDADVRSEALKLIKQNLSGATSDKDVERVVSTLWNPGDSTENNVARVEDFLATVEKNMAANDAKAQEYQRSGSLRDFKGAPANVGDTAGRNDGPTLDELIAEKNRRAGKTQTAQK